MGYDLEELYENKYMRGFDRRDPASMPDTAFDESTRIFTLSVKSGSSLFKVMVRGIWYEKTTSQTLACPNTTGTYYWYFDNTGTLQVVLQSDFDEDSFKLNAICGLVYWNATSQKAIIIAKDEMHGYTYSPDEHMYHHLADNLRHYKGGLVQGLTDGGDTFTTVDTSIYMDEDISSVVAQLSTMPFAWREGAKDSWFEGDNPGNAIAKMGTSYAQWNEWTGTVFQLTESTNSTDYIIYMVLRTNDRNNPYKILVGTAAYASRSLARDALTTELDAIELDGLPGAETKFAIAYISKRNGDLEDDGDGNAYIDLRNNRKYNTV